MIVIPAIDLRGGCVVRLLQGRFDSQTTYSRDPAAIARRWAEEGAVMIHVVDLDGAATGKPKNFAIAKKIAAAVKVPVEFGGGVRDAAAIKKLLDAGIARVVLGTRAAQDRAFLKKAFARFGGKIIVSIDAKAGTVATQGWKKGAKGVGVLELALFLKEVGFREFIFTDIMKDGTMSGPNIKEIKALLKATGMRVIASGGVSGPADIKKLSALSKRGLSGVIVGKALYEGKLFADALGNHMEINDLQNNPHPLRKLILPEKC